MGIIIQKYGGTSVADLNKLKMVCEHIIDEYEKGNKVVVVVSAQGKMTDILIKEEKEITLNANSREHDVLLSVGEQITISKLCMCLHEKGYDGVSLTGWQIPIITDNIHSNAKIKYIYKDRILKYLNDKKIVIIAGFQGIDNNGDITTLGRGGSDTTAVAIASALNAERCDIYTDVDGVFTADPRTVSNVVKLDKISYDEMIELSSAGANVLHNRCVEIGKKYNIPIHVKSTFLKDSIGTSLNENGKIEEKIFTAITKKEHVSKITLIGKKNKNIELFKIINFLEDNNIKIDLVEKIDSNIFSFCTNDSSFKSIMKILHLSHKKLKIKKILYSNNLVKVTIVGNGISSDLKTLSNIFKILYDHNINIHMITTSEIKISILIKEKDANLALRCLHKGLITNT